MSAEFKIEKDDANSLCPWTLTMPNGSTAHFTTEERAIDYRDYLAPEAMPTPQTEEDG